MPAAEPIAGGWARRSAMLCARRAAHARRGRHRDAGRDARLLVAAAAGVDTAEIIARPERRARSRRARPARRRCVARRCAREPVSRILGAREFYGRPFALSPATLDPRPDSETLIEAALGIATREGWRERPIRILDVGTGSGCLLLTLLAELPLATGVGTDISGEALRTAARNADIAAA